MHIQELNNVIYTRATGQAKCSSLPVMNVFFIFGAQSMVWRPCGNPSLRPDTVMARLLSVESREPQRIK